MTPGKPRTAAAAVFVALIAGLIAGSAITGSQDQPAPEPARTAYVDFLSLLKDYHPLRTATARIQREADRQQTAKSVKFEDEARKLHEIIKTKPADSREAREALSTLINVRARGRLELATLKLAVEEDMRREGVTAFERVRAKASDIARTQGYTELINIVGDESREAGADASIKQLERQLMISPVLMFDSKHDITETVRSAIKEQWDPGISMAEEGIMCVVENDAPLSKNAAGEFEIRLGQKVKFSVQVLKKGEQAKDDDAKVEWIRSGVATGTIDSDTGEYQAPEEAPLAGDIFEIFVMSLADPAISKKASVRLLDKEGKRLPERKSNAPEGSKPGDDPKKEGEAGGNGAKE
jgi:Spy/CpxP family protein refolding chaperone